MSRGSLVVLLVLSLQGAAYGARIGDEAAGNVDITPIHIDLCRGPVSWRNQNMELKFHNVGSIAATQIVFNVAIENQDFTMRDVGTFSPRVEIDHSFWANVNPWLFRSPRELRIICKVVSVDFVSGAHWSYVQPSSHHE